MVYSFIISKIKGCSFSKFRTGWGADFNTWENLRVGLFVLIWKENTIQCLNFPQNLASIFSVKLCPLPICNLLAWGDKERMFLPRNWDAERLRAVFRLLKLLYIHNISYYWVRHLWGCLESDLESQSSSHTERQWKGRETWVFVGACNHTMIHLLRGRRSLCKCCVHCRLATQSTVLAKMKSWA